MMTFPPGDTEPPIHIDIADLHRLAGSVGSAVANATDHAAETAADVEERHRCRMAWDVIMVHQTVAMATRQVPHYARLAASLPPNLRDVRDLTDFSAFPVLTKADIQQAPADFLNRGVEASRIRCTSGTTGRRLAVYGCDAEGEAIRALTRIRSRGEVNPDGDIVLRILPPMRRILGSSHSPVPTFTAIYGYNAPAFQRFDFEDFIAQCLLDHYPLKGTRERVTVVHATTPVMIDPITTRLVARGIDLSQTAVRVVALTGGPVTTRLRQLVEHHWKAPVVSTFSCTEVTAEGRECRLSPGLYHINEMAYAEVVDEHSGEPVRPGEHGRLLLTSLHPFQQSMPFLRYDVGDIAELAESPCACGEVGTSFRILGRRRHCVSLEPAGLPRRFLGSNVVEDVLSTFPDVPQLLYPCFRMALDAAPDGWVLSLDIETFPRPPDESGRLAERVGAALRARLPFAEPRFADESLRIAVTVHPKGDLTGFHPLLSDR